MTFVEFIINFVMLYYSTHVKTFLNKPKKCSKILIGISFGMCMPLAVDIAQLG
jgi:hypothetical protein